MTQGLYATTAEIDWATSWGLCIVTVEVDKAASQEPCTVTTKFLWTLNWGLGTLIAEFELGALHHDS